MAIKAIIFDCFGVLVLTGRQSLHHDYPTLKIQIHDLESQSDYGIISRREFNQAVGQLTSLPAETIDDRYWATSLRNESAIEWLRQLKSSGYKIGLLSNVGRGWLDDFLPADERRGLIDAEVLSGDVGMVKPALEMFEMAAQRLEVEPSECIMIDDLLTNIDAAERVGMRGVIFGTTTQARAELDIQIRSQNA
ncbi:MAG: HAD family phosphatase [Candidatus Saccharibacteria bacterium]